MGRKFPGVEVPHFPDGPLLAYAYLQARVRYRHPYLVNPEGLAFRSEDREAKVASFGLPRGGRGPGAKPREQAEILFARLDEDQRRVVEFALDLSKQSSRFDSPGRRKRRKGEAGASAHGGALPVASSGG
jgi:hypothetical protein